MFTQKFVIRLLTTEGELLGWTEEHLEPEVSKSEGCVRFKTDKSTFQILKAGTASFLSIHWCDLDVARKLEPTGGPMVIPESHVGKLAQMHWMSSIWGVQGNTDVPLPGVIVGSVTLSPDPLVIGGGGLPPGSRSSRK